MKKYEKYKKSEVDWLGEIPEHWDIAKIKWLTSVKRGASPRPIADTKYFDEIGEFAWVRIADVSASERYLEKTTERLSELGSSLSVKQYPGDLFLSIAGSVGKPIITKIKCCIHDGFVWFPELKINPEFLYYLFQTGLPFGGLGKIGTQLNLNTDTIGSIVIPYLSNVDYESIVKFLDYKTAQIDAIINKKEQLIEKLKLQRQAIINEAVTGKKIWNGNSWSKPTEVKKSGIEWLGNIPKNWEVIKLKYLASITRGAILRPVDEPAYFDENGDWTYLNISDVTKCDKYLNEGKLKLSELGSTKSARVEPNNLIITASATIGKPFINTIPVCVHDGFIPITDLKCDINFLFHYIGNPQLYVALGKSNTQKNIYLDEVKEMLITLPTNLEQKNIAFNLEQENILFDKLISKEVKSVTKLKQYRQSLISEAVTGKIDLRDWKQPS